MTRDELDIAQVINRYGVSIDSGRWDWFDELFTDDIVADYGAPTIFRGLDAFKRGAEMAWGSFDATQHAMSNVVWDLRGDDARTLTYGSWCLVRHGTPGGDVWEGKGWYDDALVRTPTGWRIKNRSCRVMSWSGNAGALVGAGGEPPQIPTFSLKEAVRDGSVGFFQP